MNIREYRHEDLEFILNKFDGRFSKRREDKFICVEYCDAFYCYVAEEDSVIKGFIIMKDMRDGVSHYMEQINVTQKRKGIGTQLVEKVFGILGQGKHISLCVNTDNKEAIAFYEDLGFQKTGFTVGYRKGQDKYWYQKDL